MSTKHHHLTNEKLKERFKNSFELVNYAIKRAQNFVDTGRKPQVDIDKDNPALIVLSEIFEGVDKDEHFEDPTTIEKAAKEEIAKKGVELVKAALKK